MKATSAANKNWITYRTRFLVKAKQLTAPLSFTDVLGRQHSGRKGDYLVESSDGVLRIAPRQIFEDIYVPLLVDSGEPGNQTTLPGKQLTQARPDAESRSTSNPLSLPPHLARKSPQPERGRRIPVSGLRSF
jgi:hypothetical protein